MSFRFRYNQDSQGEDLHPSSGFSFSQNSQSQPSQEMRMPTPLSQSQSFQYDVQPQPQPQPRQVHSYAPMIRNLQLPPNHQRRFGGGGDPRILRQQR